MSVTRSARTPAVRAVSRCLEILGSPSIRRFERSLACPEEAQKRILASILKSVRTTSYGRSLDLTGQESYDEFREKVPPNSYETVSPFIEKEKRGEPYSFSPGRILFYEKTSGSSGPAKYIPYNAALKSSFNNAFLLWAVDVLRQRPGFRSGKIFMSVSPGFREETRTANGTPVGLEDDAAYLSGTLSRLLRPFLVAPRQLGRLRDPESFRRVLAAILVQERDLEIISIWSPTYLQVLLEYIEVNREALVALMKRGSITLEGLLFKFRRLSGDLERALFARPIDWRAIWPELKLLSCWTSASAVYSSLSLQKLFPGVWIQGKGLLATEAPMTIPWARAGGHLPLLDDVFIEVQREGDSTPVPLSELSEGDTGEMVITQRSGLLRYRMRDRVRVGRSYRRTPCLEFLGRSDASCDMTGEKLTEVFAETSLMSLLDRRRGARVLLPVRRPSGKGQYLLLVEGERPARELARLAGRYDELLQESVQYRTSRKLRQLLPLAAFALSDFSRRYEDYFAARGLVAGDIKPQFLLTEIHTERDLAVRWFSRCSSERSE